MAAIARNVGAGHRDLWRCGSDRISYRKRNQRLPAKSLRSEAVMVAPKVSVDEFVRMFESVGASEMARELNTEERVIYARRRTIETQIGRPLIAPRERRRGLAIEHPGKIEFDVKSGMVLVGSDAHYWPGKPSTAHRAFVKMCAELAPKIVVLNGDVLD